MALREPIFKAEKPASFIEKLQSEWDEQRPTILQLKNITDRNGRRFYTAEELERDQEKLKRTERRFAARESFQTSRSAEVSEAGGKAEYLLMELLYNYADFGGEASVTPASKFDDYFNGVDFVLGMEDEKSSYGFEMLAVDVTIAEDVEDIINKEEKITDELYRGFLTRVKYFQLEADEDVQGKFRMPKVVLAFPRETVAAIQSLLKKEREKKSTEEEKRQLKRYSEIIKNEFIAQLSKYLEFIESIREDVSEKSYRIMKRSYTSVLNRIKKSGEH